MCLFVVAGIFDWGSKVVLTGKEPTSVMIDTSYVYPSLLGYCCDCYTGRSAPRFMRDPMHWAVVWSSDYKVGLFGKVLTSVVIDSSSLPHNDAIEMMDNKLIGELWQVQWVGMLVLVPVTGALTRSRPRALRAWCVDSHFTDALWTRNVGRCGVSVHL